MLFKLSLKNIKKSIKDYSIYFFTLVFAVAMFYMFNSIDAQSSMLSMTSSKKDIIEVLVELINYVSIFVSIILGFLIVYSNNFLIKRRKKEIGLYEILGMSKRKVSLILVIETMIVGIVSLVVGLLTGIFFSQFLSIFVSKLFEADLSSLKFVFSKAAFNKTILYFSIIFILVIIFNTITLNKNKLIDLLTADKKNEKVKIRNKYITIISFILACVAIGYAYYLLLGENALLYLDYHIILMLVSGAVGTFLLFFSLSGFLIKIAEHIKKIYYKDLNIFTLKQVNSKINTTVISTTVICLMLLLTIGMLSGSMSFAAVFNNDLKNNNLTDYSLLSSNTEMYYETNNSEGVVRESESFKQIPELKNDSTFNKITNKYTILNKYYDKSLNIKDLINKKEREDLIKEYGKALTFDYNLPIISETEYVSFMKLTNQKYIDIKENEYLLLCNIDFAGDAMTPHYNNKYPITINNKKLIPGSKKIIKTAIENNTAAGNDGLLVVSDNLIEGLDLLNRSIVGFYTNEDKEKGETELDEFLKSKNLLLESRTKLQMEGTSLGLKTMIIFLGIYLGITFAISSATVLAIGQLSESSDNKKRYKILSQIGADNKMINKALFIQIAITFMFPLLVALIHSYFGLKKINKLLISMGNIDLTSNILLTTLFMLIVYGGYFLITYISSKRIIKQN